MQQSITNPIKKHQITKSGAQAQKTWTYAELTEKTEAAIRSSIGLAQRYSAESLERRHHKTVAWGLYWGWLNLTWGCQLQGDAARLEALAEGLA